MFLNGILQFLQRYFSCSRKSIEEQIYIYVLKLEQDKWYIGRTACLKNRLKSHINNNGSEFTKLYKVISLYEYHLSQSMFDEDNTVKKYMMDYGINNVRGGAYSTVNITPEVMSFLE